MLSRPTPLQSLSLAPTTNWSLMPLLWCFPASKKTPHSTEATDRLMRQPHSPSLLIPSQSPQVMPLAVNPNTITPVGDYHGEVSFSYSISDGTAGDEVTSTATLQVLRSSRFIPPPTTAMARSTQQRISSGHAEDDLTSPLTDGDTLSIASPIRHRDLPTHQTPTTTALTLSTSVSLTAMAVTPLPPLRSHWHQ